MQKGCAAIVTISMVDQVALIIVNIPTRACMRVVCVETATIVSSPPVKNFSKSKKLNETNERKKVPIVIKI